MLKLNAGFSRKVGEPNYGSRGASVNVELELESGLVSDPDALMGRIRQLFSLARRSVDDELHNGSQVPGNGAGHRNNRQEIRSATHSQLRAIKAICQRRRLDADQLANERFGVNVDQLTLQEASSIIDELKAAPAGSRNGGAR
jgi:hypothetical protein